MNHNFRTINKEESPRVFLLMQESFPASEFRAYEKQLALLARSDYKIMSVEQEGCVQAFLAEWDLPAFRFIEHFAVSPTSRGKGLGSEIMYAYLSVTHMPIVIEVESPHTRVAVHRISFYERLGFVLSDMEYKQPSLRKDATEVSLRLMHYPREMTRAALEAAKADIFQTIYER